MLTFFCLTLTCDGHVVSCFCLNCLPDPYLILFRSMSNVVMKWYTLICNNRDSEIKFYAVLTNIEEILLLTFVYKVISSVTCYILQNGLLLFTELINSVFKKLHSFLNSGKYHVQIALLSFQPGLFSSLQGKLVLAESSLPAAGSSWHPEGSLVVFPADSLLYSEVPALVVLLFYELGSHLILLLDIFKIPSEGFNPSF